MQPLKRLAAAISRMKAEVSATDVSALVPGPWYNILREGFAGAWQQGIVVESNERLLAFSTVYACVDLIARDIAKLRIKLVELKAGVWVETSNPAYSPVLRKPNSYQTRIQFLTAWMVSKLLWGNTYVLKQRDQRNVVVALHVLDPRLVTVKITDDGGVYYQLQNDYLARTGGPVVVPQSEIIHDRAMCPFHPLIGVGPIYAAGMSATQGKKIQINSEKFFSNMSRPGGHLTAEGNIPDETAERLKREFEARFSGENIGRLLVTGSGLKYESLAMPAEQSQLIEQLSMTAEMCCQPFHVPLYKVGLGAPPTFNNVGQLNQDYYNQCLQEHIESIELLLDEGLSMPTGLGTELDLDALLRMDPVARMDVAEKGVKSSIVAIDEARRVDGKLPLPNGLGELPWMQQQNYPMGVLAKRTDVTPPTGPAPAPATPPAPAAEPAPTKHFIEVIPVEDVDVLERECTAAKSEVAALLRRFTSEAEHG